MDGYGKSSLVYSSLLKKLRWWLIQNQIQSNQNQIEIEIHQIEIN